MTIINQYLHENKADRVYSVQQINHRCIQLIFNLRIQSGKTPDIPSRPVSSATRHGG